LTISYTFQLQLFSSYTEMTLEFLPIT